MSETTREIPTLKDFFDLKTLFFIIIAFGIMLVYFLITTQEQGGLNSIVHTLITASILFIVGGVLLNFCTIVIDVLIWRLLLSTIGIRSSFLRLLNVYMTSLVSGILIPSGGTVEIGVRTTMGRGFYNHFENRNATSGEILSSIALHRLIGTLCFLPVSVLAAIGIAVILEGHLDPSIGLILVVLVALFAFCLTLLIFSVYLKPDLVIRIVNAIPIINNQKPGV
ncbi:MAG: hypothetical protein ACFFDI_17155 [Promethearchaeota archaeon]